MNRAEKIRMLTEKADQVLDSKGRDYTAGNWETDPNFNFREIARMLGGAPINAYTVCMIYFLKHVFSLLKFAKTGIQESGESLEGRHVDITNYARILWTLVEEVKPQMFEAPATDAHKAEIAALYDEVERVTGIQLPKSTGETYGCQKCQDVLSGGSDWFDKTEPPADDEWLDRVNRKLNDATQKQSNPIF